MANALGSLRNLGKTKNKQPSNATGERQKKEENNGGKKRKTRGKGGEKRKEKKTKKEGKRTEENRKGGGRWPARWFRLCFTSMKTSESDGQTLKNFKRENKAADLKGDYEAYLKDLQEASRAGFDDLCIRANQLKREIPSLTLKEKGNFVPDIDEKSQKLIPTGKLNGKYVALRTKGDGNCLYRAASILAFGDESKHLEMRVRTVVELACNKSHYLNVPNIEERIRAIERYIQRKSSREGRDKCSGELNKSVLEVEFEEEVRDTCKYSAWASDWHLQVLPTVFRRPVKIIFPEGIRGLDEFFNDIRPRDRCAVLEPLVIMWTSTEPSDEKVLNHFVPLVPASEVCSLGKGSLVQDPTKLNVTLATDAEGWDKSVNEQFLLELAQNPQVRVTGFVPKHTPKQKDHARKLNIELVDAKDMTGYSAVELLAYPPDSLDIDILIIHSYGRDLGRQAQIIKDTKKCQWVNVVHTVSEDLEKFLDKKSADPAANDQITEHELQTILCEKSDLVIAIGPKVTEAYRSALLFSGKDESVITLNPGIFEEFLVERRKIKGSGKIFRVLLSASSKYFLVKGCDIATKAINLLQDSSYRLIFVRQPKDNEDELKKKFLGLEINQHQLTFKESSRSIDFWKRLLCEVDLVIKPSRTEGFGISGLRAISADLPVLVSGNCGLGMVLMKLPSGAQHVINSDDPQAWADAIKNVRAKAMQVRREESEQLRKDYMQQFNWKMQCDEIVKKMFSMNPHKSEHRKEAVEWQFDVAETTRDLQSLDLNRDDVDGGQYHQYETEKMSIQETSQFPCTYKRGDISRRNMEVNNLPLKEYSKVCLMLNTKRDLKFDDFRMLAEKVGFSGDEIRIIDQGENPADAVLQTWSSKREATVGNLIDLLTGEDLERMDVAKVLEDWVNDTC